MRKFNAKRAVDYARRLSFPRLVGTPAEPEARRIVQNWLAELGLQPKEDAFHFFPMLPFGMLRVLLGAGLLLLIIHRLLLSSVPWFGALFGLVLPLVARKLWARYRRAAAEKLYDRRAEHPFVAAVTPGAGWQLRSSNIVADLPCRGEPVERLVLSAHTDSKSQNMSIVTRAVCSILFTLGVFVLPLATTPALFWPAWLLGLPGVIWWTFWALAVLSGVVLLTLKVANESPGAVDNAGACGVLMETAQALVADPPAGVAVRVLFTGAEELGLAGGYHYVRGLAEEPEWREATYLNFEGVGLGTKIWLATGTGPDKLRQAAAERAVEFAEQVSAAAGVKTKRLGRLVGGEADHIPLVEAGLAAVTLMFSGPNGTKIHTAGDRPELIQESSLAAAGEIVLAAIRRLEKSR
ncbi:MAG: M28 family peptidase [Candidatus Lernaella stagnicola]|nr:M28 family peptidase [Candidatus Lernaella stagnicola]